MSGSPAFDNATWLRATAAFSKLPHLMRRVRDLEKEIERLKNMLRCKDSQ